MKNFTIAVIGFCALMCAYDLAVGNYGWAIFQAVLVAININSYKRIPR